MESKIQTRANYHYKYVNISDIKTKNRQQIPIKLVVFTMTHPHKLNLIELKCFLCHGMSLLIFISLIFKSKCPLVKTGRVNNNLLF